MEIIVNENTSIGQVKKDFSESFPFLKMEILADTGFVIDSGMPDFDEFSKTKLGEIHTLEKKGQIRISGQTTVKELEQMFQNIYGLNIQIFRQSGNVWIQTTVTDSWTLTEQNTRAFEYATKAKEIN
jgi:hypothetical protein